MQCQFKQYFSYIPSQSSPSGFTITFKSTFGKNNQNRQYKEFLQIKNFFNTTFLRQYKEFLQIKRISSALRF
jgi:hypothetical protein